MYSLDACLAPFHSLFTFVTVSFRWTKDLISSVLAVNYDLVSNLIYYTNKVMFTLGSFVSTFVLTVSSFLGSVWDFITDVVTIIISILVLFGKFLILIYNVMNLIFHGIENIIMFTTSGGQWTAERVKMSISDLIDSWNNLSDYGHNTVNLFCTMFIGGFTQIGDFVFTIVTGILAAVKYTVSSCCFFAEYCLVSISSTVERLVNRVYYILTVYIPNLSKETYLGVIICCVVYLLILNFVAYLQRRGMTFPLFRSAASEVIQSEDSDAEFSDEEFEADDSNSNISENTLVSDSEDGGLDDDTSVSEDGELDEDTSDSDIDIQLPHPSQGRYNFRPTTPVSKQKLSPEEYEKQIEKEREKRKCVVCQDKKKSVLIMPCRHMCLCVECGNQIARARQTERRICPLCRGKIQTIMDVFV